LRLLFLKKGARGFLKTPGCPAGGAARAPGRPGSPAKPGGPGFF